MFTKKFYFSSLTSFMMRSVRMKNDTNDRNKCEMMTDNVNRKEYIKCSDNFRQFFILSIFLINRKSLL